MADQVDVDALADAVFRHGADIAADRDPDLFFRVGLTEQYEVWRAAVVQLTKAAEAVIAAHPHAE